jgi:signal transduction histidine kinase
LEAAVYWIAHEAAQNIRKHAAEARRAKLTLTYLPEAVVLDVRDDGPGFDPGRPLRTEDPLSSGGTGLCAWTDSVERMGGSLRVESAPGAGTTLTVTLPTGPAPIRPASARRAS